MIIHFNNHTIFVFADTHGAHRDLSVPEGADIIICAGDAVEDNLNGNEYDDFIAWFSSHPAKWKLFIPGNHEISFELGQSETIEQTMTAHGITVMQDAVIDCDGIIIGSVTGNSHIADEDLPHKLDLLVTHMPPYGVLDLGFGSLEILDFVKKTQPKYHLFAHIHATADEKILLGKIICQNIAVKNIS